MSSWPEEARVAAVGAIDRRTARDPEGRSLRITVPVAMYLATDILNAAAPFIIAAERERIAARLEEIARSQTGGYLAAADLIRGERLPGAGGTG